MAKNFNQIKLYIFDIQQIIIFKISKSTLMMIFFSQIKQTKSLTSGEGDICKNDFSKSAIVITKLNEQKRSKTAYSKGVKEGPGFKTTFSDCLDFPLELASKTILNLVLCRSSLISVRCGKCVWFNLITKIMCFYLKFHNI